MSYFSMDVSFDITVGKVSAFAVFCSLLISQNERNVLRSGDFQENNIQA